MCSRRLLPAKCELKCKLLAVCSTKTMDMPASGPLALISDLWGRFAYKYYNWWAPASLDGLKRRPNSRFAAPSSAPLDLCRLHLCWTCKPSKAPTDQCP